MDKTLDLKKVAIYIRVSTEEQAKEGYSISAQKKKLMAFCVSQGWEVAGIYPDEGISAKDMNRPKLQEMLQDIEDGDVDCVLVYRLDRLTRSVLDLYRMLEIFEKYDCKFKSATEVYDTTTAMGRMFITIVAALAQWERENMGERISMGYTEKARQGKYPLNFRPYGYNLDKKISKLIIKEDEAKIVRLMFDLYIKGMGGNRLCKFLNEQGYTTRDGNPWQDSSLMKVIKNPIYIGSFLWNDEIIENTHDPIVSKEKYDQAQKVREERRYTEPWRIAGDYIFSGKLKCANCGRTLTGFKTFYTLANGIQVTYKNYRCLRKKNGTCTGMKNITELRIEEAFLDFIGKVDFIDVLSSVSTIAEKELNKLQIPEVDLDSLQNELEKIERRKKKWQYAWSDEAMSYEDFKERMNEAKKEEEEIKLIIEEHMVEEPKKQIGFGEIQDILKNVKENWDSLEAMEKKYLINDIINEVHYEQKGRKIYVTSIEFK
ncbi:cassette chromosome recombinase B [Bacillus sp. J14TS2]|uniref:recombinase family protein n=1 Tax=Bacillus sp. J14TS2 TaxID=2807188 RepID=UPI001B215595|nr:recombinase family protein [Bacillus sp. J14TS2]GIN73992.1 cassette chromosome recombinase B [Bacillus sp. J14TS2]